MEIVFCEVCGRHVVQGRLACPVVSCSIGGTGVMRREGHEMPGMCPDCLKSLRDEVRDAIGTVLEALDERSAETVKKLSVVKGFITGNLKMMAGQE